MKQELLDEFAEQLRQQRSHFLREFRRAEEGLETMAAEREIELEEHAQEEQSALFLIRHDDKTLQAVKEIDAALQRIIDGTYGQCEACHRPIATARLRHLPAARHCLRCAARHEKTPGSTTAAFEAPREAPLPADLSLLSDREATEETIAHLKEDGRVDMQELQLVCRKGVVYLSGKLPSAAEHEILLHTLTDVLGFEEVVDHLDLERLLWETERRAKEALPEAPRQRWDELPSTEDIVESDEEDKEFVAPAKPIPDG